MPSFSIEAPGEANPLTEDTLLRTLQSAGSPDPQQIQSGTKQLQQWEKASGYYRLLQSVFIARSLPEDIRYLAIIQLKNGIDKYWRKTATNAVSPDDKSTIRSRLIGSGLDEPHNGLALQNALVVAKIVRFEYPNDWPDAISSTLEVIRSASQEQHPVRLARALLILLHIIKELSTGRLQRTRQTLQAATPEIVSVLAQIYLSKFAAWQTNFQGSSQRSDTISQMQESLLCIKILRRLLISGYDFPHRDSYVQQFWSISFEQVGMLMGVLSNDLSRSQASESQTLAERHLLQLSKLHLEMAQTHPAAFVLLPNSMNLVRAYWSVIKQFSEAFGSSRASLSAGKRHSRDDDAEDSVMEKLSLKGLLLIRACIRMVFNPAQTFRYRHAQEKEERSQAERTVRHDLLTRPFVEEMMNVVVTKFFVIRESDLAAWETEPEEWESKEENEGEGFEFSVRPCAERIFLDLAINYKDILTEPLQAVFGNVASTDNEDILFKDSVYSAIGLSAAVLFQQLDFDAFLTNTLAPEVQKQKPGYNILRRRTAILIGQWITVKISKDNRPLVCQIYQHLLDPSDTLNDLVVRITAARQFKNIADDWEFDAHHFMPYAETMLTRMMKLIEEVESTDTKMALLNTISVLVERLEYHITPYAERIVTLLPPLWEQSENEHLMKQAILAILTRLVNALKAASTPFHPMLLPIIQGAIEPGSEIQVYLLEDALDLWHAILIQSQSPASTDLLAMASSVLPILELGSESLRKALEIMESYVLLAPQEMLSEAMRRSLISGFSSLLGTLKPDANGMVNNLLEIIIRTAGNLGGEGAVQQITSDLVDAGFLPKLVQGLHGAWVAHCTTGPMAKEPTVDGIVETDYFSVLARICLGSTDVFLQAIARTTTADGTISHSTQALQNALKWLLEEWFNHLENIGDPGRRKLMVMALTRLLLPTQLYPQPVILPNLQLLMSAWTDVITELRDEDAPAGSMSDSLVYENAEQLRLVEDGALEAPEDTRRRMLTFSDPLHKVRLPALVREHVQMAVQAAGGEDRFRDEWLINVDREVADAFGKLGIVG